MVLLFAALAFSGGSTAQSKDETIYLTHFREVIVGIQNHPFSHYLDGNKLRDTCRSSVSVDQGYCVGYITGHADNLSNSTFVFEHFSDGLESMVATPCIPDKVNEEQLRDVVVNYLDKYPAIRHEPAAEIVFLSLSRAFPCHVPENRDGDAKPAR